MVPLNDVDHLTTSRTNLRRPIRAGKRRPKSYAGAEAIIAQAMAQGMAGRMHGRMAGAAPISPSPDPGANRFLDYGSRDPLDP